MPKIITKKDIKEAVVEAIEPFAKATQADFRRIDSRLDGIDGRLDGLGIRMTAMENSLEEFKKNASELFKKLDDVISMYKKQGQETAFLRAQMRRLEERVEKLES